jgi:nucleoside-diphosphate-sugar epimerase
MARQRFNEQAMGEHAQEMWREKQLVVFGAGYVGAALVDRALGGGAKVAALTRNLERAEALRARGAEVLVADIATPEAWIGQLDCRFDYVVNCVSGGGAGVDGYHRSYIDGLRSLLQWAEATNQEGRLVYTGSTSVYAQGEGQRVTEADPAIGRDERSAILVQAEALALGWPGVATVLRLAGIYGPGRHYLLDELRAGAIAIAGRAGHHLNLIHRDDVVGAIEQVLQAEAEAVDRQVFNVADDGPAPKGEVVHWLAQRLHRPAPTFETAAPGRRGLVPDRVIANDRLKRLGWRPSFANYRAGYEAILAETPPPQQEPG